MTTWGELREMARRVTLADEEPDELGVYKYSDEILRDCAWWALDIFANHTAVASATSYPASGKLYQLPGNIYDGDELETTCVIFIESAGGITYLDPISYTPGVDTYDAGTGFMISGKTLQLLAEPEPSSTVHVRYFAYHNHPYVDSDVITAPRWANKAICYLIAADILAGQSLRSANIGQWDTRPDTGHPEHNPVLRMREHFMKLYDQEIARYHAQDRVNHNRVFR